MAKVIEITIGDNGSIEVQGSGLGPNERIEDVAKFLLTNLGDVTETGHKHQHTTKEDITIQNIG